MPIKRNSAQPSKTLEEYYGEMVSSSNEIDQWRGRDMLAFIDVINETFPKTQLFGLTSVDRLVIQAEDYFRSDWYVIVSGLAGEYSFEYLMPKEKAPWQYAMVRGTAKSLDEARKFFIISIFESEGWKGNAELQDLVAALH
ncbi:MAG TPA: hypothetical protein VMR70_19700 [Flavisolibacter sp.]|nr:hypothetical protein [Flavisolibacter sp.]